MAQEILYTSFYNPIDQGCCLPLQCFEQSRKRHPYLKMLSSMCQEILGIHVPNCDIYMKGVHPGGALMTPDLQLWEPFRVSGIVLSALSQILLTKLRTEMVHFIGEESEAQELAPRLCNQ